MRGIFIKTAIVILAIIVSGLSFPVMVIFERALPIKPELPADTWTRVFTSGRFWHDLKNLITETARAMFKADSQWWSKCICFLILLNVTAKILF